MRLLSGCSLWSLDCGISYQFDKVLDFTGVFGMLICMVFPGLIFEKSRATCQLRWPHYPHNPSECVLVCSMVVPMLCAEVYSRFSCGCAP